MVKEENLEPEHLRKLFIGGLDYHTTDDSLKAYFEQYGEIVDVIVMKDPQTKRSRGFGFVAFSQSYMVDDAQKKRPHKIDGRTVDTKRAVPRDEIGRPDAGAVVKKLFVGGIKDINEEELRDVFSQFGEVVNVSIPVERETQKKRGFAFVEFVDSDSVDKACLRKDLTINDKRVDIKKALDKNEMARRSGGGGGGGGGGSSWGNNRGNQNSGGGFGGRGGGGSGGWGGNQSGGYGNQAGGYGNQGGGYGNQGGGYSGGNQGGYGGNQGGGYGGGGGGGGQSNYGGNQGGWGGNQGGGQGGWGGNQGYGNYGSNNWGGQQQQSDFGNNYGSNYGGGPMRGQGNYQNTRSAPYSGGNQGGYGMGGGGGYGGGSNG